MYLSNIGGVFIIEQQQKLVLSPYMEIYELVIPKDNLLRQIKELVDFSFIYDELLANYCLDNGRNAVPPIRMFKYLLLKSIYDLCCPYRDGCYKEGAKKKTYTETIICDSHSEQVKFQETEHFKEKMRERYKIEAKNSELKHRHGYDVASSSGLICMEMQGAMTIFAVNLKRIIKLMNEK